MPLPTLDAVAAAAELRAMTAAATAPTLADADIARLLARAAVADAAGVEPDGAGYVPTYTHASLRPAAVAGLREKLARLANDFDVGGGPGVTFARSQKQAAILALIREHGGTAGSAGFSTIQVVGPAGVGP